jgi:hypothetical protein
MQYKVTLILLLTCLKAQAQLNFASPAVIFQPNMIASQTRNKPIEASRTTAFTSSDDLKGEPALVTDITALQSYNGNAATVIVQDTLRGGIFNKVSGGVTANLGTIFAASGGGFWVRNFSGNMDINWFGAKGDGIKDNTAIIQNALNLRKSIYIKKGKYKITGPLTMYSYTHLIGEDRNTTSIMQTSSTANCINIAATEEFIYLKDLMLRNSSGSSTGSAISLSGCNHTLNDLIIIDYGTGVKILAGTTPIYIDKIDVLNCRQYGIDVDASGGVIVGLYINRTQLQINNVGMRIRGNVNGIVSNGLACRLNKGGFLAEADISGKVPSANWLNNIDVDSNHDYGLQLTAGNNYYFNQPWVSNPAPGDPIKPFSYNFYIGPAVTNVTITDLKSFMAGKNGLEAYGNKITISGADIQGSGRGLFDTYDGIILDGNSNQVSNSRIWSDQVNSKTRYAIKIAGTATNYNINNNDVGSVSNSIKILDQTQNLNSNIFNNRGAENRLANGLSITGTTTISGITNLTSTSKNARLSIDLFNFDKPALLASTALGKSNKPISIQPFGGPVLIGTANDDGSGNALQVAGKISAENIGSGTFKPTINNISNISSTSSSICRYQRIGNIVTVAGIIKITPTKSGLAEFRLSLPVATKIKGDADLGGTVSGTQISGLARGDAASNEAQLSVYFNSAGSQLVSFTYQYTLQ